MNYVMYAYNINKELEESQNIFNVISLVYNINKILIYRSKEGIKDTEFYVKELGISRL